ncbi:hypothetical protein HU200_047000 [Digitaria exilis]|uniref:Uncharacterized protein n=1 Tax=Digitaria exilis TaxID=1010633 RepID=A0A835AVK2_9POAL|nr:hypothetical protein HU200_047000 [Digitaria exilis]
MDDYSCVLCHLQLEETLPYLFFAHPFSTLCWQILGISWDATLSTAELIVQARQRFGSHIFREVAIVAC